MFADSLLIQNLLKNETYKPFKFIFDTSFNPKEIKKTKTPVILWLYT